MKQTKGKCENLSVDVEKFKTVGGLALAVLAVVGTAAVAAVAPNLISAIYKLYKFQGKHLTKKQAEKRAAQTLYYLKRTGVIRIHKSAGEAFFELTSLGMARRAKLDFDTIAVQKPVAWDGKWWLVAADIPTKTHRLAADYFRKKLADMGFKSLQRTLWFYPYNPSKELQIVAEHYGIQQFVTLMEISRLDVADESMLRRHFKNL
ncbi:MAG: hypothetical protein JNK33_00615 [Candidatus Doudnabacteria bacterium]|nr:hypothetical protein [Candidatus Doudnabacteria bacterium]